MEPWKVVRTVCCAQGRVAQQAAWCSGTPERLPPEFNAKKDGIWIGGEKR